MIEKTNLLLLASFVWLAAGLNVLKIGITTYADHHMVWNYFWSFVVFCFFWWMIFSKMARKHTRRIQSYECEKQFFWKFFDLKSFFIMAFMMTLGITIRAFQLFPEQFIAVFYTGLGAALSLAGLLFGWYYIKIKRLGHRI